MDNSNEIDSIIDQVDWIEFNIPYACKRTGETYVLPDWLDHEKIKVFRCEDIGPLTKVLYTLQRHSDKYILSIDDDVLYPRGFINNFFKDPNTAVSGSGIRFFKGGVSDCIHNCHALEGYAGILYPPRIYKNFEYFEKTNANPDCFLSDDVVISNWLVSQDIRLVVNPCKPPQLEFGLLDKHALHNQNNMRNRYLRVLKFLHDNGILFIPLSSCFFKIKFRRRV